MLEDHDSADSGDELLESKAIEQLGRDLGRAETVAVELFERTYFGDFESFEYYADHISDLVDALETRYGVYLPDATPIEVQNEDEMRVFIFETNKPGVYIAKYEYDDGRIDFAIQAEYIQPN